MLNSEFVESELVESFLLLLMASKTCSKSSSQQRKLTSGVQAIEVNDRKPLPLEISKTTKPELPTSELKSVQTTPKQVTVEASEIKKSPTSGQKGYAGSLPIKFDSSSSSAGAEQASTEVDLSVNGSRGSLEVSVDQEKKTSEYGSVKDSSVSAKVSDGASSLAKTSGSAKISDRGDFVESGKSSMCRGSTSSDVSDESTCSSFSSSINKPHKANDSRWEAIQAVRARDGVLGLNHFRLLKRLGCGDIGSVYLSELSGTKSYFAMKVMDKGSLASRKKLLRAQTEREILQSLDHPFLPTLYTHFETEKFSCLVMEFCPGGDLHTLRQRQPGKHFTEQAVKYDIIFSAQFHLKQKFGSLFSFFYAYHCSSYIYIYIYICKLIGFNCSVNFSHQFLVFELSLLRKIDVTQLVPCYLLFLQQSNT